MTFRTATRVLDQPHLIWVCVDCYFTHHYGAPSEDPDYVPDREPLGLIDDGDEITAGMSWEDHADDCPNREAERWIADCECEHISFTWAFCQACGSMLGGDRFALTVWTD